MADNKFHCIILKGGDQYPYFPRPLLSEFEFSIPLSGPPKPKKSNPTNDDDDMMLDQSSDSDGEDDAAGESDKLIQGFMLKSIQASQLDDLLDATQSTASQRALQSRLSLEIDKTLLQLLAVECREGGEERGMRALEVVKLMRDTSGKMIEAAGKIAERYGRTVLGEKIREYGEERVGKQIRSRSDGRMSTHNHRGFGSGDESDF